MMLTRFRSLMVICAGLLATVGLSGGAAAQHAASGRGGVGHLGGGVGHGGFGGFGGGGHGGHGWRGGYGWRDSSGWGARYGYYDGWGWGGLGLGLYFASLPGHYSTYWGGGVPYYYADNTYYRWNDGVRQYETVSPPGGLSAQTGGQSRSSELIAYPKNGQSAEQQATDKYQCHKWAAGQTGYDPVQAGSVQTGSASGVTVPAAAPGGRPEYLRAQAACLEGRGYSVK